MKSIDKLANEYLADDPSFMVSQSASSSSSTLGSSASEQHFYDSDEIEFKLYLENKKKKQQEKERREKEMQAANDKPDSYYARNFPSPPKYVVRFLVQLFLMRFLIIFSYPLLLLSVCRHCSQGWRKYYWELRWPRWSLWFFVHNLRLESTINDGKPFQPIAFSAGLRLHFGLAG
jgi:hypothetical protein